MRGGLACLAPVAAALACAAPAVAQPAHGAGAFQPPAGCTAHLTVQTAACLVAHHFTCEGDHAGWQRRAVLDESGVTLTDAIDAQTQWMEVTYFPGGTETLAPSNPDPADFDTLLATGLDAFDFTTDSADYGPTRYVGEDRLTGETVVIDGVRLDRTVFAIAAYDAAGQEVWRREGGGFVSRDWRMFLGGRESVTEAGVTTPFDNTPVEFVRPGEDGFLATSPRHGCGLLMSKAPRP